MCQSECGKHHGDTHLDLWGCEARLDLRMRHRGRIQAALMGVLRKGTLGADWARGSDEELYQSYQSWKQRVEDMSNKGV